MTETLTLYRIALPQEIVDHFEAQAAIAGISAEDAIAAHISKTFKQSVDKAPIHLTDQEARRLRQILGPRPCLTNAELLKTIELICMWDVGGWRIPLLPQVQEMIHAYARAAEKKPEEIGPQLLLEAIRGRLKV